MNKTECIRRAEAARHEAKLALERHALMASTFGGAHKLAQDALVAHDAAIEAHNKWMDVAYLHPSTRQALIRKGQLPAFIFAY